MADESDVLSPWLWRPPVKEGYIGRKGLRPKEAPEKVTGRAIYTNDVYIPGMLYAKVLRSPYAHARIKKMDSRKAEALPGVWAVIRYDDSDIDFQDYNKMFHAFTWFWWRDSILPDTADSYGIRLGAMVIADSEEICDEALGLIRDGIEWEQLPFILDGEKAAQPDAPLMHPELNPKSNVWKDIISFNIGDVEKGFASSDNIIEFNEIKTDDDIWAGVEPGCIVARWLGEDLEIWYHGQNIAPDEAAMISSAFKNDDTKPRRLKIHAPYNGATFGGNCMGYVCQMVRYAVIAARKTMRPVKVIDDYGMSWEGISFEVGTAHIKVGFNNDGTIVAIRIDTHQLTGIPIVEKFVDALKTPNIQVHEIQSFWSKSHQACWKDGTVNCSFVNLILNKVAAHLNMDPIKVQLLNDGIRGHDMTWLDEHVKKPNGLPLVNSLEEVVKAGKAAFDWDHKWHAPGARKLPNGKMHGVAFYATNAWSSRPAKSANPGILVGKDGKATIFYRRADTGQSAPTTYCQIVADEIGLRYEDVNIDFTESSGFDANNPAGSMGTSWNTTGLAINSRKLKSKILEYALKYPAGTIPLRSPASTPALALFKGKTIDDLDIREGIIFEKSNPKNSLPVRTIAAAYSGTIFSDGGFFISDWTPDSPQIEEAYTTARQCVFIEVEVDTETGQIEVTNLVHPYDVGQSINPDVHQQQLYGGAYAGLGVSGTEAIYYDPQTGVKLNDNLIGYPVLTILDLGPIECPIIESHLGWAIYGAYGCSEAGKAMTGAAMLVPAVYNAIGKWIEETPVTPERVLKALGKA